MTYKAIVSRIKTRPFPGADRLKLGTAYGFQVVVGLDTNDDDLGVYWPTDGQLSDEFCAVHNLIGRTNPQTGAREGGYFAANRRVRTQKFRGEKSEGYWTPISYLEYTGADLSKLREGDQIDELNGHKLCNKYFTEATINAAKKGVQSRSETKMFRKHFDTEQFRFNVGKIPAGAHIIISIKCHGTSHRVGYVKDDRLKDGKGLLGLWRTGYRKFINLLGLERSREWTVLHGSRNVILNDGLVDSYYKADFRQRATASFSSYLHKGEVIYGEIVGWVSVGVPIMAAQDTTALKDKAILKQYGPKMIYKYGMPDGECKFLVYRISQVNEDGYSVELSWNQVVARSRELGLDTVPVVGDFINSYTESELRLMVESVVDGPDPLDQSHIREGVCIRVEHPAMNDTFKHKSYIFNVLEGNSKEKDDAVDTEEAA